MPADMPADKKSVMLGYGSGRSYGLTCALIYVSFGATMLCGAYAFPIAAFVVLHEKCSTELPMPGSDDDALFQAIDDSVDLAGDVHHRACWKWWSVDVRVKSTYESGIEFVRSRSENATSEEIFLKAWKETVDTWCRLKPVPRIIQAWIDDLRDGVSTINCLSDDQVRILNRPTWCHTEDVTFPDWMLQTTVDATTFNNNIQISVDYTVPNFQWNKPCPQLFVKYLAESDHQFVLFVAKITDYYGIQTSQFLWRTQLERLYIDHLRSLEATTREKHSTKLWKRWVARTPSNDESFWGLTTKWVIRRMVGALGGFIGVSVH